MWWGPSRMPRRTVNLISVAVAAVVVVWIGSGLLFGGPPPADPTDLASTPAAVPTTGNLATPAAIPAETVPTAPSLREYALAVPELEGLPPDITTGSRLDVWVSWEPPVAKRPKIQ